MLIPGGETPVFEWRHRQGLRKCADGFEEWLIKRCQTARKQFKNSEWEAIRKGPEPFNEKEKAIIEARKKSMSLAWVAQRLPIGNKTY
jgi:hypothetical protein